MSGHSTLTNLLTCDATIADWLNSKTPVDIILLDFARALDKVQYHFFLAQLVLLRVAKQPIQWIENYLMNRSQQVVYGNAWSAVTPVTSRVIRGSSLGPFLFLGFINDLHKKFKNCKLFLFADVSKMVSSAKTMANCLLA